MNNTEPPPGAGGPDEPRTGVPEPRTPVPDAGVPRQDGGNPEQAAHRGHHVPIDMEVINNMSPREKVQFLMQVDEQDLQTILPQLSDSDKEQFVQVLQEMQRAGEDIADGGPPIAERNEAFDNFFGGKDEAEILGNKDSAKIFLTSIFENKEDAKARLQALPLSPEAIDELVAELPDPDNSGEAPELPPDVQATGNEGSQRLHEMEAESENLELPTEEQMAEANMPEEQRAVIRGLPKRLEAHKANLASLSRRFTGYFAEGEPGRKYARIGGKIVYFALLTAFIALLLEMNLISKASGKRR